MSIRNAVGIIETRGFSAALQAADTAVKAANVDLLGYELARGGGLVAVKIRGDVGAVTAAVEAGGAAAAKINDVASSLVKARPHEDLEVLIHSPDNVFHYTDTSINTNNMLEDAAQGTIQGEHDGSKQSDFDNKEESNPKIAATCNLCNDPKCSRKKGEPKQHCKHYKNGK